MTRLHSRFRRASTRRAARSPQTLRPPSGPPPPPPPFGEGCQYAETDLSTVTSSTTTYQTHLTLAAGVLPPGDYWLGWWAYYAQEDNNAGDAQISLTRNGAELINYRGHTDGNGIAKTDSHNFMGFAQVVTLPFMAHTFAMGIRVGSGGDPGDEAALYWAAIELWSFN